MLNNCLSKWLRQVVRLCSFICVVAELHTTIAQTPFAEIPTSTNKIDSIKAFVVGDSVLVSYQERVGGLQRRRFSWVFSSGKVTNMSSPFDFFHVVASEKGLNFYYFDKGDDQHLKAFQQANYRVYNLEGLVDIGGKLIASYVEDDLYLLVYDKPNLRFTLLQIRDLRVVQSRSLLVDKDFDKAMKYFSGADLFREGSWLNSFGGTKGLPIFKTAGSLIIPGIQQLKKPNYTAYFRTLDLKSNMSQMTEMLVTSDGFPALWLAGDEMIVYTFSKRTGTILKAININTKKLVAQDTLPPGTPIPCTVRTGRGNRIERADLLQELAAGPNGYETLVELPGDSENRVLQCALYVSPQEQGIMLLPGAILTPLAVMAIYAATTALVQSTDPQGILRYFYVTFDGSRFTLDKNPSHLRQRLDDWEFEQVGQGKEFESKTYVDYKGGLLGIYQVGKENKISLIEFH